MQNIISMLSRFISWYGWLNKGPGRVRFQGEVEVCSILVCHVHDMLSSPFMLDINTLLLGYLW